MSAPVLDRPAGLLVLLAIPLAWWLARRFDVPRTRPTGAVALWREVATAELSAARRRRLPPGLAWLTLALAAGALALAGPRGGPMSVGWTLVVDRSPSMYLPLDPSRPQEGTRLEAALARAAPLVAGGERRWVSPGEPTQRGVDAPAAWRSPPAQARAAPDWSSWDRPDVLWVTDAEPPVERRHAGLAASGGAAVPGGIGGLGHRVRRWDGAQLVEIEDPAGERRVVIDAALPPPVAAIARAWAEARGLEPVPRAAAALLWIEPAGGVGPAPTRAQPGRVRVGRGQLAEPPDTPRGAPEHFAVAWSELFDRWALAPAGTVALAERLAAGPGRSAPASRAGSASGRSWIAPLALLAALAAAFYLRARRSPRRRADRATRPPVRSDA